MKSNTFLRFLLQAFSFFSTLQLALALPQQYGSYPSQSTSPVTKYENRHQCRTRDISVRREWGTLSRPHRRAYIHALQCLQSRPSHLNLPNPTSHPLSRYDDFAAVHINETLHIHSSGIFFAWHRHFSYLFEKALREECGFKGTQPYWNWPLYNTNLASSPLFDGSETSLGGDGEYNATWKGMSLFLPNVTFPIGRGGGPIARGPFKGLIAPFKNFRTLDVFTWNGTLPSDALVPAPHPVRRDLNNHIASTYLTPRNVTTMLRATSISTLQDMMLGNATLNYPGPHTAGHYAIGPDMADFFASPSDPAFWLHHGMIDLIWQRWQARGRGNMYALSGGTTTFNIPESKEVDVDTVVEFGGLDGPRRLGELMDIRKGMYCYRYEY